MNPLYARLRFKLRTLTNILLVLFAFCIVVFSAAAFQGRWIIDIIAMVVLFFVYFGILDKRVIGINCPECTEYIGTNTPWMCGFCQKKNERVDEFPFVNRCEHCSAEPKAYRCHHCTKTMFLTQDRLARNCAYFAGDSSPVTEAVSEDEQQRRRLDHELRITKLTTELNDARERLEQRRKKTPKEALEADFAVQHGRAAEAFAIAKREKAANAERFKDDPEWLVWSNKRIDEWLQSSISGGDDG